jgi:hypothetical protein
MLCRVALLMYLKSVVMEISHRNLTVNKVVIIVWFMLALLYRLGMWETVGILTV